jgi:histidinol-phosphate aminotransferase
MDYSSLLAPHLESLPPYSPIEPFEVLSARLGRSPNEIIKLDANENPYGPAPAVRRALATLRFPHIYPDPESRALRAALAEFTGLPQANLMAGAGADELIDLILRVFLQPGERVLSCPPTFGMYAFDTHINAGQIVEIPRRADFSLDLPALLAAVDRLQPKLLFLTSPNNPDGSLLSPQTLERLLELPLLVVLDEAYVEFAGQAKLGQDVTRISQVLKQDNLVVLRTFSKWAGLAGLRVGYGAFPGWLMPTLWKAKQPYNVNVAASQAAIASLQVCDLLADTVQRLRVERQRLMQGLNQISYLQPYPSQANFVLCKVMDKPAGRLKAQLAERYSILVRYFDTPLLQDHIRISVGRPAETDAVLQALRELEDRELGV